MAHHHNIRHKQSGNLFNGKKYHVYKFVSINFAGILPGLLIIVRARPQINNTRLYLFRVSLEFGHYRLSFGRSRRMRTFFGRQCACATLVKRATLSDHNLNILFRKHDFVYCIGESFYSFNCDSIVFHIEKHIPCSVHICNWTIDQ